MLPGHAEGCCVWWACAHLACLFRLIVASPGITSVLWHHANTMLCACSMVDKQAGCIGCCHTRLAACCVVASQAMLHVYLRMLHVTCRLFWQVDADVQRTEAVE